MDQINQFRNPAQLVESSDVLRGRFTNWLSALVYREKLQYIRKLAARIPETSLDELIEKGFQWEDPTALQALEALEDPFPMTGEVLSQSYSNLSPKRQEILKLLFVDEMDPVEVAARMNCTVQHIYNRRSQALKALRAAIGEGGDDCVE